MTGRSSSKTYLRRVADTLQIWLNLCAMHRTQEGLYSYNPGALNAYQGWEAPQFVLPLPDIWSYGASTHVASNDDWFFPTDSPQNPGPELSLAGKYFSSQVLCVIKLLLKKYIFFTVKYQVLKCSMYSSDLRGQLLNPGPILTARLSPTSSVKYHFSRPASHHKPTLAWKEFKGALDPWGNRVQVDLSATVLETDRLGAIPKYW